MRQMTDAERALAQDAMRFVPLAIAGMNRSFPGIHKQLKRIDAESIALLAVCRASQTYDPAKSAPTTYFSRAIRNALLKEIVKRKRLLVDGPMRIALAEVELEEHNKEATVVGRALSSMPDALARVIRSRFYGHMTLAEIATQEGCTRFTVRRRLTKALLLFRAALEIQPRSQ